jgi:hypothetical protein
MMPANVMEATAEINSDRVKPSPQVVRLVQGLAGLRRAFPAFDAARQQRNWLMDHAALAPTRLPPSSSDANVDLLVGAPVIYRKTTQGLIEIETRATRLSPRLRSALIVIDGKRSDIELAALLAQGSASLAALVQLGFIEATPERPPAKPAVRPVVAQAAAVAATPKLDFEARRRQVLRAFTDCVGPAGDGLAIKLEKAKTLDDFRAQLHQAVNMVDMLRGRSQAQAFAAQLSDF